MRLSLALRRCYLLLLLLILMAMATALVLRMLRITSQGVVKETKNRDIASQLFGTTSPPLSVEEKRLIFKEIRSLLSSPSSETLKLDSPKRRDHSQHGQSHYIDVYLRQRRNGYFIESGASDGETGSNSLFFERERNWTGLLIEANRESYNKLMGRNRHAFALNTCISPSRRPVSAVFKPAGGIGGLVDQMPSGHLSLVRSHGIGDVNITCYSINDIVAALDIRHVDYWSLDVEGAELGILRTIDWAAMPRVDVISVEFKIKRNDGLEDRRASVEKLQQLKQLFDETGMYKQIGIRRNVDVIFARI